MLNVFSLNFFKLCDLCLNRDKIYLIFITHTKTSLLFTRKKTPNVKSPIPKTLKSNIKIYTKPKTKIL